MKDSQAKEIAFFGKITAAVTHEMKNVLAIIKESAGLMEDLFAMSQDVSIPHREKIQKTLSTIKTQVQRGVALSDRLNKLAHAPDGTVTEINLNEEIEHIIELSRRFARLKNVDLQFAPSPAPVMMTTGAFQLQMTLFNCIACYLDALPPGGIVNLYHGENESAHTLHLSWEGSLPDSGDFARLITHSANWPVVQTLAHDLGGKAELAGANFDMILYLPKEIPRDSVDKNR